MDARKDVICGYERGTFRAGEDYNWRGIHRELIFVWHTINFLINSDGGPFDSRYIITL